MSSWCRLIFETSDMTCNVFWRKIGVSTVLGLSSIFFLVTCWKGFTYTSTKSIQSLASYLVIFKILLDFMEKGGKQKAVIMGRLCFQTPKWLFLSFCLMPKAFYLFIYLFGHGIRKEKGNVSHPTVLSSIGHKFQHIRDIIRKIGKIAGA